MGQCQASILWALYAGRRPPTPPGTSNAVAPTLTPAARRPCVLPPHSQSRPGFLTRSSTPHSPQAAPPTEKETQWGGLPPGIMTQLQKGGGVTPGQSPQHTPHAQEAVWAQAGRAGEAKSPGGDCRKGGDPRSPTPDWILGSPSKLSSPRPSRLGAGKRAGGSPAPHPRDPTSCLSPRGPMSLALPGKT